VDADDADNADERGNADDADIADDTEMHDAENADKRWISHASRLAFVEEWQ
jgi:hypothetical protein